MVGGFAAALLVVFLLFKFVFGGINDNPAAQSYKVPDVLGKTVEEAQQMEGCLLYTSKPLRQLLAAYMKAFARRPEHRNMAVHTDCNLMD